MLRICLVLPSFLAAACLVPAGDAFALKQVAPSRDAASVGHRDLKVYYSYNQAMEPEVAAPDRFRVFLLSKSEPFLKTDEELVAEVKITDVNDYGTYHRRYIPVSIDRDGKGEYKQLTFDVNNDNEKEPLIKPARVYRLFVNLHRKSDEYGSESVIGHIPRPYYVATSGESTLEKARQQIVMRTFKEFYYRKRGWRSGESYPMDCYAYYMWATGFCTVGSQNGRTKLNRLFGSANPYHNGSQIPLLRKKGPIHADYVRKSGHSFMLLGYDESRKHIWAMEGNYNSTIEVVIRSVSSDWRVGHLDSEHIRPEAVLPETEIQPAATTK